MKQGLLWWVLAAAALTPVGGCGTTSDQRIAALQRVVNATAEQSNQMDAKIVLLQRALASAQNLLADPNLASATLVNIRADVATLQAKLDAAKPVKQLLDQNLVAYQAQLTATLAAGPVDIATEAKTYGQGITAVSPILPPPWNALAALLGVAVTVGGAVAGAAVKGRKDAGAISGIVASVDALLQSDQIKDLETAKNLLARAQVKTPGAAAMVAAAKEARGVS
jgi:hypothetical protein